MYIPSISNVDMYIYFPRINRTVIGYSGSFLDNNSISIAEQYI